MLSDIFLSLYVVHKLLNYITLIIEKQLTTVLQGLTGYLETDAPI